MQKENKSNICLAAGLLLAFVLWTVLVRFVDVQAIGPEDSAVGFATVNKAVHNLTGVHMALYTLTDWLGLVPIGFVVGFAGLGLWQWIKRKRLKYVDYHIFVLGGFYIAVMAVYVLFEKIPINYRPVLIDGLLEVSYPSSTTILVMCVVPAAMMQFNRRIKNKALKRILCSLMALFVVFMVIGRLISGVHWFSDIIGGILVSSGLVMLYRYIMNFK